MIEDEDDDDEAEDSELGPHRTPAELRSIVLAAATCAAVVLASQLAGKAARDAIFLQEFQVKNLPLLLAVSSTLAIGTTLLYARRLTKGTPFRVVQFSNLLSVVLLVGEWAMLPVFPRVAATAIYVHQTLIGPILVSGFWSVVSECFDPRTARKVLGTVGTGATVGAVIGAIIAERVSAMAGSRSLLIAIAALQLIAAWRIIRIGKGAMPVKPAEAARLGDVLKNLTQVSLLRRLALVTVVVTIAAAFLDYVFKAQATISVAPENLPRVFALFHGAVGILTALVQWLFGRIALEKLGLARTLAALPGTVMAFGISALVAPGIATFVLLRGSEYVVRNSLYREAYEVLYTPLLVHERRTTKTVIDVGVERLGDALGGLSVIAILAVIAHPQQQLLFAAVGLSLLGVIVALKARASYVEALERSLRAHAVEVEKDDSHDKITRNTLEMLAQRETAGLSGHIPRQSMAMAVTGGDGTGITGWRPSASGRWLAGKGKKRGPAAAERSAVDPTLHRVTELVSNDPARIKSSLLGELLSPAAVAYAIPLLARKDVVASVEKAIAKVAGACLGQLVDAVRDPLVPLPARMELPKIIATAVLERQKSAEAGRVRSELARAGLTACLADAEFEVRFRAAAALGDLREHVPDLQVDAAAVFDGVRRELAVDPAVWRALDEATMAAQDAASSGVTPKQLSRAAQHLATLLALALPADPVRTAFQSLWSEDKTLRGVALEYLDNVLPDDIRERMWLVLALEASAVGEAPAAPEPKQKHKRPVDEVLAELLKSRKKIATPAPGADDMRGTQIDLPRQPSKPPA